MDLYGIALGSYGGVYWNSITIVYISLCVFSSLVD